ncbi:MAG: hypothetical protein PHH37_13980 [Paludibacter sp.]|nr:hypothetical protein [Paludibacter sp.]
MNNNTNIKIELVDRYAEHLGCDARSESQSGLWYSPADKNRNESHKALEKINHHAQKLDLNTQRNSYAQEQKGVRCFDMGTITNITDTTLITGTTTAVAAIILFLREIKPLILEWIKNRGSRSVKIEIDGVKIEVTGHNDIDKIIEKIKRLKSSDSETTGFNDEAIKSNE